MAQQIVLPFESKVCTKCLRPLPTDRFRLRLKRGRHVRCSRCKCCERAYGKTAYHRADKRKLAERMREYRKSRPDVVIKANAACYRKFREKRLKAQSEYYAKHRTLRLKYAQKYRIENASKIKDIQDLYYDRNRFRFIQAAEHRRTRALNAKGAYSIEEWLQKCVYWGWRCYLCECSLTPDAVTIEHRIPLIRDGSNWLANIAPACLACNRRKGAKTESEYRQYLVTIAM